MRYRQRLHSPRRQQLLADRTRTQALMRQALEDHAATVKREYEGFVADWSDANRPQFTSEVKVSRAEIRLEVRPYKRRKASTIFGYVDRGTQGPYPIRPKRTNKRGRLAYRQGYSARTLPVAQAHVGSGSASGPWVFPKEVTHPGIEARLFSETVQKRTTPQLRARIERLFRQMARDNNR
ncbi:hypothetical protein [Aggregatilinea lenta]|uniref:hypothetical protein n=1 Tax=Aggregatilinea lenta TaxID=913108 RepID=UPI000E5C13A5|nr:hypothetical protein [Aggregatilinea lenta]